MRGVDARRSWLQYESIFIEIALCGAVLYRTGSFGWRLTVGSRPAPGARRRPRLCAAGMTEQITKDAKRGEARTLHRESAQSAPACVCAKQTLSGDSVAVVTDA